MYATFNDNYCTTVSYNNSANASDEMNITSFYSTLSSLVRHIPIYSVQIIMNDLMGKGKKKKKKKFCWHNLSKWNGEYQGDFWVENRQAYLNSKIKKGKIMDIHQPK